MEQEERRKASGLLLSGIVSEDHEWQHFIPIILLYIDVDRDIYFSVLLNYSITPLVGGWYGGVIR